MTQCKHFTNGIRCQQPAVEAGRCAEHLGKGPGTRPIVAYMTPVPPQTPVLEEVWKRAQQHYYETGRPEVYVTPEEFHEMRHESDAIEAHKQLLGLDSPLKLGGEIGNFLGTRVIVQAPSATTQIGNVTVPSKPLIEKRPPKPSVMTCGHDRATNEGNLGHCWTCTQLFKGEL